MAARQAFRRTPNLADKARRVAVTRPPGVSELAEEAEMRQARRSGAILPGELDELVTSATSQ